jgi:aminoglycoside phosphotransferase (APT) family kinase protein
MKTPERSPLEPLAPHPLADALVRMALVNTHTDVRLHALAGGVSSDIYRADLPTRVICVKRALPKLKVAADWRVPVERSRFEVAYLRIAATAAPGAVPRILGEDEETGAFAMEWLPPETYPTWKSLLAAGTVLESDAAHVGAILGRIHSATAESADVAAVFRTDALFHALRLEPYLVTAASAHPDLAGQIGALISTTANTRRVLVHGDFSPKNILLGPNGPTILDAECAWFGDPAFDVAFVLNHLLLKAVWRPAYRALYRRAFAALVAAYGVHVTWEPWDALDARTAALLPALLLARIDGKSPVEYLTTPADRDRVRQFARAELVAAMAGSSASPSSAPLAVLAARWFDQSGTMW